MTQKQDTFCDSGPLRFVVKDGQWVPAPPPAPGLAENPAYRNVRESRWTLPEPRYRFGDQRPDGMYFYARRPKLLTSVWLTEEAFRRKNGGKLPSERKGRLRADGRRFYRGAWVSREVFDKLLEGDKIKKTRVGSRKFMDGGTKVVFAGYTQGKKEVWVPEGAWVDRQRDKKQAKAARKAHQQVIQQPKTCGQFVREGLVFVGEFSSMVGSRPTRVYFNCAQWKAAAEGQTPPPELKRTRLRAYWWLVRRIHKNK